MDVKTIAVSLQVTGAPLNDFLQYLHDEPDDITQPEVRGVIIVNRLPHAENEHLWVGFVLSRRDQRVIPLMTIQNRIIEIRPEELAANTNKIDVNFFLINDQTQKGLYQNYFGSQQFTMFSGMLRYRLLLYNGIRRAEAFIEPREIIREDSLDAWLRRVGCIQQIVYEYELVRERATNWDLLKQLATTETVKLVYKKKNLNWNNFKEEIRRITAMNNFKKFILQGETDNPLDKFYDLLENKDIIDLQDFDQYARSLQFHGADLHGSLDASLNVQNLVRLYEQPRIRRIIDGPRIN